MTFHTSPSIYILLKINLLNCTFFAKINEILSYTFSLITLRFKVETFQNWPFSSHIQFGDQLVFKIKFWFQPHQISYAITQTVDQCLFLSFVPKASFKFSLTVEQNKQAPAMWIGSARVWVIYERPFLSLHALKIRKV